MSEKPDWFYKCGLKSQLCIALALYLDSDEGDFHEGMESLLPLMQDVLSGETEEFSADEWWPFYDGVGLFRGRTEELNEIYEIATKGYYGKLPEGPTKCFVETDDGDDEPETPPFLPEFN